MKNHLINDYGWSPTAIVKTATASDDFDFQDSSIPDEVAVKRLSSIEFEVMQIAGSHESQK
jgi:hypothetical protein